MTDTKQAPEAAPEAAPAVAADCFVCGKSINGNEMSLQTFNEQKTLSKESRLRCYHSDCFWHFLSEMTQDERGDFLKHNAIYRA